MTNTAEFGRRLREGRQQRRISAAELARRLNIDYMQVYRYERGEALPSFATAVRLARVFQISLDELANGTAMPPPPPPPIRNQDLLERMRALDDLPPERQELALRILDALLAGELDGLARRMRGGAAGEGTAI